MKTIIIVLCAVALTNMANAQNNIDVPSNIKADFASKFPAAKKVRWESEGGKYGSSFYLGKKEMSVEYNSSGALEEMEIVITFFELPITARHYVRGKGKISEVGKVQLADGTIRYEAELEDKYLIFDKEGNFLEERAYKGING